jgi:hypothetical protein
LYLTEEMRKHPIVLEAEAFNETVRVKLPEGFAVDGMPDPVKLDTPFGTYSASYEIKDNQLHFTRALVQRAATIPPPNTTNCALSSGGFAAASKRLSC